MIYIHRPAIMEVHVWNRLGDHPLDATVPGGAIVSFDDKSNKDGNPLDTDLHCKVCRVPLKDHGWIGMPDGKGYLVCPGDLIITGVYGELYPAKRERFESQYEPLTPAFVCPCGFDLYAFTVTPKNHRVIYSGVEHLVHTDPPYTNCPRCGAPLPSDWHVTKGTR